MPAKSKIASSENVFAQYTDKAWPFKYKGTLKFVNQVRGGTPTDPKVAEGWIRSKVEATDDIIAEMVAEALKARGVDPAAATDEDKKKAAEDVKFAKHLNGFKKDENGLYLDGRQLKAALKEAVSVSISSNKLKAGGWGATRKGLKSFLAEHIMVVEDKLHLYRGEVPVTEPDGIDQKFIHTWQGSGISYEEYVVGASLDFTVISDWDFSDEEYGILFLTGGEQGLGASRSQGYGRYIITSWARS